MTPSSWPIVSGALVALHAYRAGRERCHAWLLAHLPAGLLWYPAEAFLALLCGLSGAGILLGANTSSTVARVLPEIVYGAWGLTLLVGGLSLAWGLASIRRTSPLTYIIGRMPVYRLGLRLLCLGTLSYSITVISFAGVAGLMAAGLCLALSGAMGIRLLTLPTRAEA